MSTVSRHAQPSAEVDARFRSLETEWNQPFKKANIRTGTRGKVLNIWVGQRLNPYRFALNAEGKITGALQVSPNVRSADWHRSSSMPYVDAQPYNAAPPPQWLHSLLKEFGFWQD